MHAVCPNTGNFHLTSTNFDNIFCQGTFSPFYVIFYGGSGLKKGIILNLRLNWTPNLKQEHNRLRECIICIQFYQCILGIVVLNYSTGIHLREGSPTEKHKHQIQVNIYTSRDISSIIFFSGFTHK